LTQKNQTRIVPAIGWAGPAALRFAKQRLASENGSCSNERDFEDLKPDWI